MESVEERGGSVKAIESGFMQREIHRSAMAWQRAVESGERVVVGVNSFQVEEAPPKIFRPDESSRDEVLRDLDAVRAERDGAAVRDALDAIEETARGAGNLMGPILEAVDRYATLGEVCGRLEDVFGSYSAPEVLG